MSEATPVGPCSPCLIVSDLVRAIGHYRDGLGFDLRYSTPAEAPFFALIGRGPAQIMLKEVAPEIAPQPNAGRHPHSIWDLFVYCEEPDALWAEIEARAPGLAAKVADRQDGLRGFDVADPDGYVTFFGAPGAGPDAAG
ncbi:MAG: VOC family protein [Pseudomonadota bacterium]